MCIGVVIGPVPQGWSMDQFHRGGLWTRSTGVVYGPGPQGWSMDQLGSQGWSMGQYHRGDL